MKDKIENPVNLEPADDLKQQAKEMIEVFLPYDNIDFDVKRYTRISYLQNLQIEEAKTNAIKCCEQTVKELTRIHSNIFFDMSVILEYLNERIQHYKDLIQTIKDYEI